MKLIVCTLQRHAPNPHSCGNSGSLQIAGALEQALDTAGLPVTLERVACLGLCLKGPNVRLAPEGKVWHAVKLEDVEQIVAHLKSQV